MGEKNSLLIALLEKAEEYCKTSIELLKLKSVDVLTAVVSSIISRVAAILAFFMSFIMGSIGLALWLGEIFGKSWYGFLVVAGIYFIIGFVLFFILHKWIKRIVGDFIIKQVFK
jgi:hypothetical protein